MNRFLKGLSYLIVALVMIIEVFYTPFRVYAFDESAVNLNIDTTSVEVKNAWAQIKNAAVIHLVAQKMQRCIRIGQVILNANDTGGVLGGTVWPRTSGWFTDGVLDTGNVFKTDALFSGDINTNIGVGPWMSSLFKGQSDGIIECNDWTGNDGNLFNMFVYVLKNYKAGMSAPDLENASVNMTDRLNVVCNKDDLTKPGLLQPSNWYGTPTMEACNDAGVDYYTGVSVSEQEAYIKRLYETMRLDSGNDYIAPWDSLENYDEVDGFYLYSNDFSKQCSGSNFLESPGSDSNYTYVSGFKVDNSSGNIKSGYYEIKNSADSAKQSFVGGTRTCVQLVQEMKNHIEAYVRKVNLEVFKACRAGVDTAIEEKRREINEKYIDNENAASEEKEDAQLVLDEYQRIQDTDEYTARIDDDGNEVLIRFRGEDSLDEFPSDYILTCRAHLPFVDVVVQREDSLDQALVDEFYDACYDAVDLAWVVCPIINGITGVTDAMSELIEDFF